MSKPFILLTNDDGFRAPGIKALATALEDMATLAVVAPQEEQSGCGRKISIRRPLRAIPKGPLQWAVDGTPTDCAYLAIFGLLDRRPDLVISGINRGPNLAEDVFYSGTVAAAMEAASVGIPAFGISLAGPGPRFYEPAAQFAVRVARFMLQREWPDKIVLNVNVPPTNGEPIERFRWTPAGRRDYAHHVTRRDDPGGLPYYWLGTGKISHFRQPGSDCDTIEQGCATITPLRMDLTDEDTLQVLSSCNLPNASGEPSY